MKFFFENLPEIKIHMDINALYLLRLCKGSNPALARNAITLDNYNLHLINQPSDEEENRKWIIDRINPTLKVSEEEIAILLLLKLFWHCYVN